MMVPRGDECWDYDNGIRVSDVLAGVCIVTESMAEAECSFIALH